MSEESELERLPDDVIDLARPLAAIQSSPEEAQAQFATRLISVVFWICAAIVLFLLYRE